MKPSQIRSGAWTARWADWEIEIRRTPDGWETLVRRSSTTEAPALIARKKGQLSAAVASEWGCKVIARDGAASPLLLTGEGTLVTLPDLLDYTVQPKEVS